MLLHKITINWSAVLITLWSIVLLVSMIEQNRPGEDWLEVRSVYIHDTTVGVSPRLEVDREVKQEFTGRWFVDVDKVKENGRLEKFCSATGTNNYSPENDTPSDIDLDWWTYPINCTPTEPGKYVAFTTWQIYIPNNQKEVKNRSNIFTVR